MRKIIFGLTLFYAVLITLILGAIIVAYPWKSVPQPILRDLISEELGGVREFSRKIREHNGPKSERFGAQDGLRGVGMDWTPVIVSAKDTTTMLDSLLSRNRAELLVGDKEGRIYCYVDVLYSGSGEGEIVYIGFAVD